MNKGRFNQYPNWLDKLLNAWNQLSQKFFQLYNQKRLVKTWQKLYRRVFKLYNQGKYAEAFDFAEQALDLARSIWLDDHPNVATSLSNFGFLLDSQGKLAEAKPYYRDALAMNQRLYKSDHSNVANSFNNLGLLLQAQGKLAEAEPYLRHTLAMNQRLFEGDHPDVANSFNSLGLLLQAQGKLADAEPYYRNALAMRQKLFAGDHLDVAISLNNLGYLLLAKGQLAEAEIYYRNTLAMLQRLFKEDRSDVATSLNNLGLLLRERGRLNEAESYLRDALRMIQKLFAGDHRDVASSLNNLGSLLQSQGRLKEAEPYFRDALAMLQRLFASDHPDVATSLNNLGLLLKEQRRLKEAKSYVRDALGMYQRLFEGDHPNMAISLNNLGSLLQAQEKLTEAEPYLRDALGMYQRLFEDDHPHVAISLNNLGSLLQAQEKLTEAEPYLRDALTMFQKLFGDNHPNVANTLNNLGLFLVKTDRYQEALEKFQEAVAVEQKITSRVFAFSSEADRLHHLQTIRTTTNALLSLVVTHLIDNPEAVRVACDVVLQRKGLSAAAVAAFNAAIYDKRYQHLREQFQQWRSLNEQIIYWTFKQDTAQEREHLRQLKQEADSLEKYLASQVPEIQLQDRTVNRQTVAQRLPAGSVLLEFVRFNLYDFVNNQWISSRYLVFIIPAGQPDEVKMEVLEDAGEIEELIARVREQAITTYKEDLHGKLVRLEVDWDAITKQVAPSLANPASESSQAIANLIRQYLEDTIQLRQTIFDPIRQYLGNSKQIIISPDASLSLVPFQILPFAESKAELLIDYYSINYISAARDLFRSQVQQNAVSSPNPSAPAIPNPGGKSDKVNPNSPQTWGARGAKDALSPLNPPILGDFNSNSSQSLEMLVGGEAKTALIIGDPKFWLSEIEAPEIQPIEANRVSFPVRESVTQVAQKIQQLDSPTPDEKSEFSRVKETGILAQKVADLLGVKPHLQEDALTTYLTDYPCPDLLLIGTHGIYSAKAEEPPPLPLQIQSLSGERYSSKLSKVDNPMLRSGLAFTGAENWSKGHTLPAKVGKGYLSAQDIALLDLWANKLTVLCACQSAVGDFGIGEGVFGLRRAFAVAGAKILVMSLWSVPTRTSALLMERFFHNLDTGMGYDEALQEAQNYIRTITIGELKRSELGRAVLEELETTKLLQNEDSSDRPLTHPFFWGAWICQGIVG